MTITATAGTIRTTGGMTAEERKVIFASSLGTVFEWYDFYIYGTCLLYTSDAADE